MLRNRTMLLNLSLMASSLLAAACGGGASSADPPAPGVDPVVVGSFGPNALSYWDAVAANTITASAAPASTDEERIGAYQTDMATVHLAIYDAIQTIAHRYQPYAYVPEQPVVEDSSLDAAVGAAAYGVLSSLFPNRKAQYQQAFDDFVAALPENPARQRGLDIGAAAGGALVRLRAADGRAVSLPAFVPGSLPGQFSGSNPVLRFQPFVRPFALQRADQFRADGPPPLTSTQYASDVNETMAKGGMVSAVRTPAQLEAARFHTEPPPRFWPRNLGRFAQSQPSLVENSRLMALLWTTVADATTACFESKYHFLAWRPSSAITRAESDGNPATQADPGWQPVVPTPNHPEYPAAHTCVGGAVAEVLANYYRTTRISFFFDSQVTQTRHDFDSTDRMVDDLAEARIYGGMHFRSATVQGAVLGRKVAQWVLTTKFQAVPSR